MYKKFCILLFVTIFCNGVTYSSPAKVNSRDLILKEQEASTEVVSHINHKVESNNTAPVIGVPLNQTAIIKTSSNHSAVEDKSIPGDSTASEHQVTDLKNFTQNPATIIKTPNATINGSINITSVPTTPTPAAVPVTRSNATDLPPANFSDMSRPIIPGNSTTPVSTLATGTTTKSPVTMSTTTVTPKPTAAVSTATENVHLEHNSSKAQENRFDGASFVGGIVLTIGLTAIGFIAFKYYKSGKIDGNYRSL